MACDFLQLVTTFHVIAMTPQASKLPGKHWQLTPIVLMFKHNVERSQSEIDSIQTHSFYKTNVGNFFKSCFNYKDSCKPTLVQTTNHS